MDLVRELGAAFGVDPTRFQAIVAAYESRECRLCESTGRVGAVPCPLCGDRLALVEARRREAGCGDADKGWLIEEVKRLRRAMPPVVMTYGDGGQYGVYDSRALLARAERERRHGEWAMRRIELLKGQRNSAVNAFLAEALNSGDGVYRP